MGVHLPHVTICTKLWFTLISWHVMVWISASHTKPEWMQLNATECNALLHSKPLWTQYTHVLDCPSNIITAKNPVVLSEALVMLTFDAGSPLKNTNQCLIYGSFQPQQLEPREKTSHHNVAITANSQRTQRRRQMFCSLQILAQLSAFICTNAHAWDSAEICLHDLSLSLRRILQ